MQYPCSARNFHLFMKRKNPLLNWNLTNHYSTFTIAPSRGSHSHFRIPKESWSILVELPCVQCIVPRSRSRVFLAPSGSIVSRTQVPTISWSSPLLGSIYKADLSHHCVECQHDVSWNKITREKVRSPFKIAPAHWYPSLPCPVRIEVRRGVLDKRARCKLDFMLQYASLDGYRMQRCVFRRVPRYRKACLPTRL